MKLWTQTFGEGEENLILIHGMGSASTAWKLITPELRKSFRITLLDFPGHGNTPFDPGQHMDPPALAVLVLKTLHDLGIYNFHLAGSSLGGWVALDIAASTPDQVKSVTAIAPAGLWLSPFWTREPIAAASKYLASGVKLVAPNLLRFQWARKVGFARVSPLWREFDLETMVDATVAMGSAIGYLPAWDGFLTKRFDKSIAAEIPITILFGDTDNSLPARTCQERTLTPPHARWIILPDSGHAPMWDHPREVIAEIKQTAGVFL